MTVARRRVICIISPRKSAYSETFIQAHLRRLPAEVKLLHGTLMRGGDFPAMTEDDRPLLSLAGRGLTLIWRETFGITVTRFQDAALRRYLRREKVEAVLAEFGYTGASVSEACHAAGVPLIVHFHGNDAFKQKWLARYQTTYRRMFSTAAAVIAVSRDSEQRLADLGAPRDRLFYNPCGADTSIFTGADPGACPPTFLSVGRFVDSKAPHLTLLAFREVVRACPEARLIMVGDGALMEACRQLTRALDMEKAVDFLGVQSHAEVAALTRETRAFVLHSVTTSEDDVEGTPVAVLEAGAAGLPVVSTRHAGIKDVVIHSETGFLVDERDIQGMAGYMVQLARDPGLAARLSQRAREHVCANFSMEKSLATLWRIIEGVLPRDGS
ncbi:MAG: glycosyltransferase [bacterium]|uniref:Glycosyltransferase n=1 Tax=Candidatus Methylomirabilis tolerans TaxID=3123416 RepID=A0AAJ1EKE7_9BACT|nr:glycosyltransferase [Candidatus Methylomirabilis sp.]